MAEESGPNATVAVHGFMMAGEHGRGDASNTRVSHQGIEAIDLSLTVDTDGTGYPPDRRPRTR